jgi:hypothetical protein
VVGKAERQACVEKSHAYHQETRWSSPHECRHAKETVGDDEGQVGEEEEVGVEGIILLLADLVQ